MKLLSFILFLSFTAFGQNNLVDLNFRVKLDLNGQRIGQEGTTIELFQEDKLMETTHTDTAGRAHFSNLALNHIYTVKFRRKGYVTKMAELDLHYSFVSEDDFTLNYKQKMEVLLFKPRSYENFDFLEKDPVIKFAIDTFGVLNFDKAYLQEMKSKIGLCLAGLTARQADQYLWLRKSVEFDDKNEACSMAVELGDILISSKQYWYAETMYWIASKLTTNNAYILEQYEICKFHNNKRLEENMIHN